MKKLFSCAVVAVMVLFAGSLTALAHTSDETFGQMGGFGMMGSGTGHYWLGWITMLLVWALLIAAIVALVKWIQKK